MTSLISVKIIKVNKEGREFGLNFTVPVDSSLFLINQHLDALKCLASSVNMSMVSKMLKVILLVPDNFDT